MTNIHDIVVIGGSMGAFDALRRFLPTLPPDLPASLFVVLHLPSGTESQLPELLALRSSLPVAWAEHGQTWERGRVYVAPADHHLMLHDSRTILMRGPHENRTRPAIDPLFRSAAVAHGPRVIGVVLTGLLSDGTAGLGAVKACGGLAVIQDPADAFAPEMPNSALAHVPVDHCVAVDGMGALIARLVAEPAGPMVPVPEHLRLENQMTLTPEDDLALMDRIGARSTLACPECHGVMWERCEDGLLRFRCHVGHAFSSTELMAEQSQKLSAALWSALRAHEERTELLRRLVAESRARGRGVMAEAWEARIREYEEQAALLRALVLNERPPPMETEKGEAPSVSLPKAVAPPPR